MKKNLLNILFYSCLGLFLLLLILILTVDVSINPITNYGVGLYSLNELFLVNIGDVKMWDMISDVFLVSSILSVFCIACLGLYQLIKYKSFKKVDSKILLLGGFIVIMIVIWLVFDNLLIINYRPIYIDGQLEGSFPSTHILVVTFVYLVSCQFFDMENKTKLFKIVLYGFSLVAILLTSVGRMFSLMHWFTDVLGGILLGLVLYFAYLKILQKLQVNK